MNRLVPMTPATTGPQWMPTRNATPRRAAASIRATASASSSAIDATRAVWSGIGDVSPPTTMYASPIVLTFSSPWRSTSPSKTVNTSLRTVTSSEGDIPDESRVNSTMSANRRVTSSTRSAIIRSPPRSRRAMGSGRMLSSSRSFSAASRSRSRTAVMSVP